MQTRYALNLTVRPVTDESHRMHAILIHFLEVVVKPCTLHRKNDLKFAKTKSYCCSRNSEKMY